MQTANTEERAASISCSHGQSQAGQSQAGQAKQIRPSKSSEAGQAKQVKSSEAGQAEQIKRSKSSEASPAKRTNLSKSGLDVCQSSGSSREYDGRDNQQETQCGVGVSVECDNQQETQCGVSVSVEGVTTSKRHSVVWV